jgi:hypothetical protein
MEMIEKQRREMEASQKMFQQMGIDWDEFEQHKVASILNKGKKVPLYKIRDKPGKPHCDIICGGCLKEAPNVTAFRACSQCGAARYCSRECQVLDWKGKGKAPYSFNTSHKERCPIFKAARDEYNNSQVAGASLRKYFKWTAELHHPVVESCFDYEFYVRMGLHKRIDTSFWARPSPFVGGTFEHSTDQIDPNHVKSVGFLSGSMLLRSEFPSLKQGWVNLKGKDYPPNEPPKKKPDALVQSWKEYMEFRGLPSSSIAPLLLNNVMTVFQMLKELGITSGKKDVCMLGVEFEMNMIPLFGELAYLMPDLDLTLIMISPCVKTICEKAKEFPDSIISKAPMYGPNHVVYDNNPTGFGRVQVVLYPKTNYWHEGGQQDGQLRSCHAAIGLNAGIASYRSWIHTFLNLVRNDKPFAFSAFDMASMTDDTTRIAQVFQENREREWRGPAEGSLTTKLNPFHNVVNRDLGIMVLPNIDNGYLLIWNGERE